MAEAAGISNVCDYCCVVLQASGGFPDTYGRSEQHGGVLQLQGSGVLGLPCDTLQLLRPAGHCRCVHSWMHPFCTNALDSRFLLHCTNATSASQAAGCQKWYDFWSNKKWTGVACEVIRVDPSLIWKTSSPVEGHADRGGRAIGAGLLAARAASTVARTDAIDTGIKLESLVRAGLTGPIGEALAMYYQVRSSFLPFPYPATCAHPLSCTLCCASCPIYAAVFHPAFTPVASVLPMLVE